MKYSSKEIYHYAKNTIKSSDAIIVTLGRDVYNNLYPDYINIKSTSSLHSCFPEFKKFGLNYMSLYNNDLFNNANKKLAWLYHKTQNDKLTNLINKLFYNKLINVIKASSCYKKNNFIILTELTDGLIYRFIDKEDNIIELNGNINRIQCSQCNKIINQSILSMNSDVNQICKNCKSNILRPNIRICQKDLTWLGDKYISTYESKYYDFLYRNKHNTITFLELGVNYPLYDYDPNGILKELGENLIFDNNQKSISIRVNTQKSSKVSTYLKYFLEVESYESLLEKTDFDIDDYLAKLKNENISQVTKLLDLKPTVPNTLYSRTVNSLYSMRQYELADYKKSNNILIDVVEDADVFMSNLDTESSNKQIININ